jgi:hypothetical protein
MGKIETEVRGQISGVRSQGSDLRGQISGVRSQRAEDRGRMSARPEEAEEGGKS